MEKAFAALLAGLFIGFAIGTLIVGARMVEALSGVPIAVIAIVSILMLVGGIFLGSLRSRGQAVQPPRFSGRVFEFPQAPLLVEIALKRAGYVVKRGERR